MKEKPEVLILDDADRLLSVAEVAARLRTTQPFVRALIEHGLLGAIRFGSNRRVPKSELGRFLAAHLGEDLQEALAAQMT